MNLISLACLYFAFGCLMGVINKWNKKVFFGIWIFSILYIIVVGFGYPSVELVEEPLWMIIYNIAFFIFGLFCGENVYK